MAMWCQHGDMGRTLAWVAVGIVAVVVVGMIVISLLKALLGLVFYLIIGGVVVVGGFYLYHRARAAIGGNSSVRWRGRQ